MRSAKSGTFPFSSPLTSFRSENERKLQA
jgi:hypothetical protein